MPVFVVSKLDGGVVLGWPSLDRRPRLPPLVWGLLDCMRADTFLGLVGGWVGLV